MPYIVIIADEMADMMMTSGKDVEGHIIRLAQEIAGGRHPPGAGDAEADRRRHHRTDQVEPAGADCVPSLEPDRQPRRPRRNGGRAAVGQRRHALPRPRHEPSDARPKGRIVGDDEINNVIEFFGDYEPQYSPELATLSVKPADGKAASPRACAQRDDMYEQAVEVVIREGRGSVSLLQRALGVGYGRGARLIDYMAEDGIVGEYNGSQAREVLYTWEQWQELKEGQGRELVGVAAGDEDEEEEED